MAADQCHHGRPRVAFSALADGGAKRARVAEAEETLLHLANEDAPALLLALCKRKRVETPSDNLNKFKAVLYNIRTAFERCSPYNKRQMLSLVAHIFSRSELRELGFQCSESAYNSARVHADSSYAGAPVPQKIGSRSITTEQKKAVLELLHDNAPRAAPNRMVYTTNIETGERELRPVFYLEKSRASIYTLYKRRYEENAVSFASFNRIVNTYAKEIKDPRRWTGIVS